VLSLARARPSSKNRYIDLWYNKPLYGRIDQFGNAVATLQESALKVLDGSPTLFAVDFVADAFEDFRNYYINTIANRQIEATVGDLTNITATSAWSNVDNLYQDHLDQMKDYFIQNYLLPNDSRISSAKDVFLLFHNFLYNHARDFPMTKTGFILSNRCPPKTSGLMIEMISNSHGDDFKKASMLSSTSFERYVATAARYGFRINKNAPWTLVANLGSPIMKEYMRPYGLEDSKNYFSEYAT
jgi:hypothetical protein